MTIPEDHLKPPPGAPDSETLRLRELHAIAELLDILAREIDADVPPLAFLTDVAEQRLLFYRMMEIASESEINQLCETHCKRPARTVLTVMCYSVGSATRQGSSSFTRLIGQSAMTLST